MKPPANWAVLLSTEAWLMLRMTGFGAVSTRNDGSAEEEVIIFGDLLIFWWKNVGF